MKKNILLVLVLGLWLLNENLNAQSWTWDAPTSVSNGQKNICRDAANNLYLYGNSNLLNWYNYPADTIKKITATGQPLYQMVLPMNMRLNALVSGPDTSMYMGGSYSGTLIFANTTYTSAGTSDIFVARFNKSGNLLWMKTVTSAGEDYLGGICVRGNDLVVTGTIEDTADFMGQVVPKIKGKDLFVAIITNNGVLQNIKLANGTNSPTLDARSQGGDCKVDAAGNIYILSYGIGINKIDTFKISHKGAWDTQWEYTGCQSLIKFNGNLQPQFVKELTECFHYCYQYYNLQVSTAGDSYLINHYYYGQSGNDDMWSTIFKFSNTGASAGSYRLRPDRNSYISDIALDCFDNLYFTGYSRPETNHIDPHSYSFALGRLAPSLTINWLIQDSLDQKFISGNAIGVFGKNDLFINGVFRDTVQLLNTITTGTNGGGFYGRFMAPGTIPCDYLTTIAEHEETAGFFYPNPSTGLFYFSEMLKADEVMVYSVQGSLVLYQKTPDKTLDLSALSEGMYFVTLAHDKKIFRTEKVILRR